MGCVQVQVRYPGDPPACVFAWENRVGKTGEDGPVQWRIAVRWPVCYSGQSTDGSRYGLSASSGKDSPRRRVQGKS